MEPVFVQYCKRSSVYDDKSINELTLGTNVRSRYQPISSLPSPNYALASNHRKIYSEERACFFAEHLTRVCIDETSCA